jgi:hypothetical protein
MERIKICRRHPERETPLIQTMAFRGAEYWCPWCGTAEGMMGAGRDVDETDELLAVRAADAALAKPYIRAIAARSASSVNHEGEWVCPQDLPDAVKAENAAAIAAWKYRSNTHSTPPTTRNG